MNKTKLQTLKGFRDFLPQAAKKRQWLKDKMSQVFESWGYRPIETPTLEYLELFKGQIGEDEKLFYQFKDLGGRQVALRYDQTVPTCRFIGEHYHQLVFPFRRYQIQPVFRADKPQKGRYREFIHSDIDIFGVTSPTADAEVIGLGLDLYQKLGFKKVVVKLNNRDLMAGLPYPALAAIDKLEKIGEAGVLADMQQKGISQAKAKKYLKQVKSLKPDQTIKTIFDYLAGAGFPDDWYQFQPTLARSFSYSQGPIWEIVVPGYQAGSVAGGERFDDLVAKISGQKVAGTGMGIGFERTLEAAEKLNLLPAISSRTAVLVTVFDQDHLVNSLAIGRKMREKGLKVEVYPEPKENLTGQLDYANKKKIGHVVIVGPDEVKNKQATLKNMATGQQTTDSLTEIIKLINESSA